MIIKGLEDENFINYKLPSMLIAFPTCSFKCDKECGLAICQNSELAKAPNLIISHAQIVERYLQNDISKAIVCGGLEPFDSWQDLQQLIIAIRDQVLDDIVIYTGYTEDEIQLYIQALKQYKNIIIKFGRYIPNQKPHYDSVLGIYLASDNQYANKIS